MTDARGKTNKRNTKSVTDSKKLLAQCRVFENIRLKDLDELLNCLKVRYKHYSKDEVIIYEGDHVREIGILLSGSANIVQLDYFGNRNILSTLSVLEPFAVSYAFTSPDNIPISIVSTDLTTIAFLSCQRIVQPCNNACSFHRQLVFNLLKIISEINISFHEKLEITSKKTTREKFIAYLLIRAKECGGGSFYSPFNRTELADYLGVDRSGLSVEINKLIKNGSISAEGNHYKILKPKDLSGC